jgi:hypothetical protein
VGAKTWFIEPRSLWEKWYVEWSNSTGNEDTNIPNLNWNYERIRVRRGTGKAIVAVARKFLGVIYHTLKDDCMFEDFPTFVLAEGKA